MELFMLMRSQFQSSCDIFNHIVVQMKNLNSATLTTISPCLASLRLNRTISITAKPKICIINVLGGGCPSKWHRSNSKMVFLLFILTIIIFHNLILLQHLPLDWIVLILKDMGRGMFPSHQWIHLHEHNLNIISIIW